MAPPVAVSHALSFALLASYLLVKGNGRRRDCQDGSAEIQTLESTGELIMCIYLHCSAL